MPTPLVVASREPVKYATPDDVLIDTNDLPVDLILKLTLEKIGGLELINLVRHDTVNGQNIVYRPVKNISQIAIDYNPQNIIKMPDSADSYFKNFSIKLENHIQQTTNELPPLVAYIDETTQNVVIDLVNLKADYEVEVQMVSSGKVFNDTIYTEDS
jgi:antitoxin component YwqK of YwqJK toxin-antitoxin module